MGGVALNISSEKRGGVYAYASYRVWHKTRAGKAAAAIGDIGDAQRKA